MSEGEKTGRKRGRMEKTVGMCGLKDNGVDPSWEETE